MARIIVRDGKIKPYIKRMLNRGVPGYSVTFRVVDMLFLQPGTLISNFKEEPKSAGFYNTPWLQPDSVEVFKGFGPRRMSDRQAISFDVFDYNAVPYDTVATLYNYGPNNKLIVDNAYDYWVIAKDV
jgi:hypothetical protein